MMKTLIVINGRGESYDLLEVDRSPTFQVEGFGYEDNTDFMRIGSSYYALEDVPAQGELSLKILLWKDVDKVYKEFISHCRHEPLTILYGDDVGNFITRASSNPLPKLRRWGLTLRALQQVSYLPATPIKSYLHTTKEQPGKENSTHTHTHMYTLTTPKTCCAYSLTPMCTAR